MNLGLQNLAFVVDNQRRHRPASTSVYSDHEQKFYNIDKAHLRTFNCLPIGLSILNVSVSLIAHPPFCLKNSVSVNA